MLVSISNILHTLPFLLGSWRLDMWPRGNQAPVAIEILQKYQALHAFGSKLGRRRCYSSLENEQGGSQISSL